jgi:hypothetical protein
MSWKIDKGSAQFGLLGAAAQRKWDEFQNAIYHKGEHPAKAAERLGAADYKRFGNSRCGQHQIRLSQSERATFTVDEGTCTVKVLQVGGHT